MHRAGAELGGTCLRIGCIPVKAWAQTASAPKQAAQTSGRPGVRLGAPELDFPAANQWKDRAVKRRTGRWLGRWSGGGADVTRPLARHRRLHGGIVSVPRRRGPGQTVTRE